MNKLNVLIIFIGLAILCFFVDTKGNSKEQVIDPTKHFREWNIKAEDKRIYRPVLPPNQDEKDARTHIDYTGTVPFDPIYQLVRLESLTKRINHFEDRIDSLEAKLERAHVVVSEYWSADSAVYIAKHEISFEPVDSLEKK